MCLQQSSLPQAASCTELPVSYCGFARRLRKLNLHLGCSVKISSKPAFRNHLLPAVEKWDLGAGFLRAAIFTLWWLLQLTGCCSHLALTKNDRLVQYFIHQEGPEICGGQRVMSVIQTLKLMVTQKNQRMLFVTAGKLFQTMTLQHTWILNHLRAYKLTINSDIMNLYWPPRYSSFPRISIPKQCLCSIQRKRDLSL